MTKYKDNEPLIVTSHDKGMKRGISIYFGLNELNELEKHGIDIKSDRRFLCRITADNEIVLIPFSKLDQHMTSFLEKRRMQKMVDKEIVDKFSSLAKDDFDEFRDELIDYLIENEIEMNPQEKTAMFQFVKGKSGKNLVSDVLTLVNRADSNAVNQLSGKFLKPGMPTQPKAAKTELGVPKSELKITPPTKFKISGPPKNLLDQINNLGKSIKSDLVDDLLAILTEEELEGYDLTQREKLDILQLTKGHLSPAAVFNTIQLALRVLDQKKWAPVPVAARNLDKELKFGVELVPATGLDKIIKYGKQFEAGGIDNIWITDHYNNMDPYVTLTLMAKATSAAVLGVGVTNPYMRHLASTASVIASLDRISNNRMVLGLGAGDKSTLAALNIETKSALKTVYETVKAIRMLWSEDNVNFTGDIVKLENARLNFKPDRSIPIYVGAQGPKMLALAGEIGDGILINGSNELDFEYAHKNIMEGINRASRNINETDVVAYTCFSTSDKAEDAAKATIPVVTFIAAATPPRVLERHDLNVEIAAKMREHLSKGNMGKAFGMVDASYIEAFSISGTPQQCLNKIESLKKAGVSQFVFGSPLGPKKKKAIGIITENILGSYS